MHFFGSFSWTWFRQPLSFVKKILEGFITRFRSLNQHSMCSTYYVVWCISTLLCTSLFNWFVHRSPACLSLCIVSRLQYATYPCQSPSAPPLQRLMSLNTPRWTVALITNHGCLAPTAASTAALGIIDVILHDGPRLLNRLKVPLSHKITAETIRSQIGKHFALSCLYSLHQ